MQVITVFEAKFQGKFSGINKSVCKQMLFQIHMRLIVMVHLSYWQLHRKKFEFNIRQKKNKLCLMFSYNFCFAVGIW